MKFIFSLIAFVFFQSAYAATYVCKVDKQYAADLSEIRSKAEVEKFRFVITIKESSKVTLDRCSFAPSLNAVSCDNHEPDRVEFTNTQYVKIKKFYLTKAHYDIQIFEDLKFIENNGRAGIATGKCTIGL
jgi:hypothetical protein